RPCPIEYRNTPMVTTVETITMSAESRSTMSTMPSAGLHPPTCTTCGPRRSAANSNTTVKASTAGSTDMLNSRCNRRLTVAARLIPAPTSGSSTGNGTIQEKSFIAAPPASVVLLGELGSDVLSLIGGGAGQVILLGPSVDASRLLVVLQQVIAAQLPGAVR